MRPRLFTIAGGLAALALYAGILMAGAAIIRNRDSVSTPEFVLETPEAAVDEPMFGGASAENRSRSPPPNRMPPRQGLARAARPVEPGLFAQPGRHLPNRWNGSHRDPRFKPEEKESPLRRLPAPVALAAGLSVRRDDSAAQGYRTRKRPRRSAKRMAGAGLGGMVARTAFAIFCGAAHSSAKQRMALET